MQIVIITAGSRGDVQPYMALGKGLMNSGHQVRLATHGIFGDFVRSHGLDFHPAEGDPRKILEASSAADFRSTNPITFVRGLLRAAEPILYQFAADCEVACRDADAVIFSLTGFFTAFDLARRKGAIPIPAYLQPVTPTHTSPNLMFPELPGWFRVGRELYNRLTHMLVQQVAWYILRGTVNRVRTRALNLPPLSRTAPFAEISRQKLPVLYGYSRHVLSAPSDWGAENHVTGYWFLDAEPGWHPPSGLVDFLESGPPPVYVGFGSMTNRDPEAMTSLVLNALAKTKQRGVILTGWGGLTQSDLPDHVYKVESIDHSWLFPQMAALIHHGGAGTTAAGLRSGVPGIALPFLGDQLFWGQQINRLGVGPRPIPHNQITAERLASAIQQTTSDKSMRQRAATLGSAIRAEDGVGQAVAIFNRYACP